MPWPMAHVPWPLVLPADARTMAATRVSLRAASCAVLLAHDLS